MRKNLNLIALLGIFGLILGLSLVMGADAVTLESPAQDAVMSGATYTLNATIDDNDKLNNIINVTFYYRTATGSWTILETVTNTTSNETNFVTTLDTTAFNDSMGLVFNATAHNRSSMIAISEDPSTGVAIDNGVPTATYASNSMGVGAKLYADSSFIVGIDADNTIGIKNCTIFLGASSIPIISTDNACSRTIYIGNFSSLTFPSNIDYLIMATDANSNTTNTSSREIMLYQGTSTGSTGGTPEPSVITPTPTPTNGVPTAPARPNVIIRTWNAIVSFFRNLFT